MTEQIVLGGGANNPSLRISGVSMRFGGVHALRDVSVEVTHQEIFGIIGPNGAGKTTLLSCVSGILQPDSGRIHLGDTDITNWSMHRIAKLGVGRTFQAASVIPGASVLENVLLGEHLRIPTGSGGNLFHGPRSRREERRARQRALDILDYLGLVHLANARTSALSHGDTKIVEVARALALRPRLLLLDEPTSGMNAEERNRIGNILRQIRTELMVMQMIIEHDVSFVRALCDRLLVLNFGEVLAVGRPDEVLADARVQAGYLGQLGGRAIAADRAQSAPSQAVPDETFSQPSVPTIHSQ